MNDTDMVQMYLPEDGDEPRTTTTFASFRDLWEEKGFKLDIHTPKVHVNGDPSPEPGHDTVVPANAAAFDDGEPEPTPEDAEGVDSQEPKSTRATTRKRG